MLEDRPYMHSDYGSGSPPWMRSAVNWLIIVLTAIFVLGQINAVYTRFSFFSYLVLNVQGIRHGYLWQLITFQFLHVDFWHLFGNVIGLYFFGRFVEQRLGTRRFLLIYFLSGITGGMLQTALAFVFPDFYGGGVLGASAGVFGLIAAFALIEPEGLILLYFIVPLRAKYLLYFEIIVSLFFILVPSDGVAHAAHLGGILFAIAYLRVTGTTEFSATSWNPFPKKLFFRRKPSLSSTAVMVKAQRGLTTPTPKADLPPAEFISQEIDPILDKISAQGIQSLTSREREVLQAARNRMSKR